MQLFTFISTLYSSRVGSKREQGQSTAVDADKKGFLSEAKELMMERCGLGEIGELCFQETTAKDEFKFIYHAFVNDRMLLLNALALRGINERVYSGNLNRPPRFEELEIEISRLVDKISEAIISLNGKFMEDKIYIKPRHLKKLKSECKKLVKKHCDEIKQVVDAARDMQNQSEIFIDAYVKYEKEFVDACKNYGYRTEISYQQTDDKIKLFISQTPIEKEKEQESECSFEKRELEELMERQAQIYASKMESELRKSEQKHSKRKSAIIRRVQRQTKTKEQSWHYTNGEMSN